MTEAAAKSKTYVSDKPSLTLTVLIAEGEFDSLQFVNGLLTTENAQEQAAVEASELFRSGHVRLAPPPTRAQLEKALADAKAKAGKSASAAAAAKAAVEEFLGKPKALQAIADADAKAVSDAAAALAALDAKPAAPAPAPAKA